MVKRFNHMGYMLCMYPLHDRVRRKKTKSLYPCTTGNTERELSISNLHTSDDNRYNDAHTLYWTMFLGYINCLSVIAPFVQSICQWFMPEVMGHVLNACSVGEPDNTQNISLRRGFWDGLIIHHAERKALP